MRDDDQAGRQVAARLRGCEPLGLAYLQRSPGGLHLRDLGDDVPDPGADPAHQRRRLLRHRVPPAQGHLVQPGRPPHRPCLRLALPGVRLGGAVARLGQSYFSRGYLEEVNAGNANTSNWLQGGGINQDGEIHAVNSSRSLELRHRRLRGQGRPQPRRRDLEPGRRHGRHRDLGNGRAAPLPGTQTSRPTRAATASIAAVAASRRCAWCGTPRTGPCSSWAMAS